ncbi:Cro/Cl family transcriptional regulator [Burkholderia glumae]|uniref:Cro/Cl family transcriptional regulator n=1 Tax=Burkholderia glumae TaxID=337 RepID=UPI00129661C3|nr:Cro/Cl family transcriptional regulator [Burkholderia glumae]QGA37557.1 Cro/Cl family transcriptional regulator [Burkholderia glumae]
MKELLDFINGLDADQREQFAAAIGTSIGYLRKAISAGQLLRPALCVRISRFPGSPVTVAALRPDDWQEIWPVLAESKEGA